MYQPIKDMQVIQMIAIQWRNLLMRKWLCLDQQLPMIKQMSGWRFTEYKKPLLDSRWFRFAHHLHLRSSFLPWTINLPFLPGKPWSTWMPLLHLQNTLQPLLLTCCPNSGKTNVTPNHWWGSGLQKVSHFHIHSNRCALRRKALMSHAWSLNAFHTTSCNDVTCISPESFLPWMISLPVLQGKPWSAWTS